jgi:Trypsin-like peptidase domain
MSWASAITVGRGRGFVIHDETRERVVVTACHALPNLPSPHRRSQGEGCTFERLLAPLREKPAVACEVLFADPIADLAVLGASEDRAAYDALVATVTPLRIARVADERRTRVINVQLQSLLDEWFVLRAVHSRGSLWLHGNGTDKIVCGMSGSAILNDDGAVVAVLTAADGDPGRAVYDGGGPQAVLSKCLPTRFLAM